MKVKKIKNKLEKHYGCDVAYNETTKFIKQVQIDLLK